MKKIPPPLEHAIMQEIINYLKYKDWYVMRLNSGRYSVGEGRSKRYIMGQEKGTADIAFGLPYKGLTLIAFIEVKSAKGKLSLHQETFRNDMKKRNIFYCIARSIEEVESAIQTYLKERI